jgi:hypothetical protein
MFSTYALESGLGGILGLLVTLALRLNCYKEASAFALIQNSQNLLQHDAVEYQLGG